MQGLVTCPVCEGKGWVSLKHSKKPETSQIGGNVTALLGALGFKEKPKLPFKTCPNCNGLGLVRG